MKRINMKKMLLVLTASAMLCMGGRYMAEEIEQPVTEAPETEAPETEAAPIAPQKPTPAVPVVRKGLVKVGKDYYFYKQGKPLKKKWKTIDGKKYYFRANGKAAVGVFKIKKVYYLFSDKGVLYRPSKTKMITIGKKTYLVDEKGRVRTGFQQVKGKFYYFSNNEKRYGKMLAGKTVHGVKLNKDGTVNGSATMIRAQLQAQNILNSIAGGASQSGKLRAAWNYVVTHVSYSGKYPDLGNGLWPRDMGMNVLSTGTGNCYGYACAFAALAHAAGYYPVLVNGRVPGRRDGAPDGYTRHCWVEINGLSYDPEGQAAGWATGIYGSHGYPMGYAVSRTSYRLY